MKSLFNKLFQKFNHKCSNPCKSFILSKKYLLKSSGFLFKLFSFISNSKYYNLFIFFKLSHKYFKISTFSPRLLLSKFIVSSYKLTNFYKPSLRYFIFYEFSPKLLFSKSKFKYCSFYSYYKL